MIIQWPKEKEQKDKQWSTKRIRVFAVYHRYLKCKGQPVCWFEMQVITIFTCNSEWNFFQRPIPSDESLEQTKAYPRH